MCSTTAGVAQPFRVFRFFIQMVSPFFAFKTWMVDCPRLSLRITICPYAEQANTLPQACPDLDLTQVALPKFLAIQVITEHPADPNQQ